MNSNNRKKIERCRNKAPASCCEEKNRFSLFGDYFYGTSGASNLYYATKTHGEPGPIGVATGEVISNEWTSGFRIGADYAFAPQGWTTDLTWFNFTNTAQSTAIAPLLLSWSSEFVGSLPAALSQVVGTWEFGYNQLDLTFGKELCFSQHYSLTPKAGAAAMWINEKLTAFQLAIDGNSVISTEKNFFEGFGFKAGFLNSFHLGSGVSIDARSDVSILYGINNLQYENVATYLTTVDGVSHLGQKIPYSNSHEIIPCIDTGIYLRWANSFADNKFGLAIRIGYEFQALINGFTTITEPTSGGVSIIDTQTYNVYVQGLIVGARFSF